MKIVILDCVDCVTEFCEISLSGEHKNDSLQHILNSAHAYNMF